MSNFFIFFLLSLTYCFIILYLTYLFVYKKINFQLQNFISFGAGTLVTLVLLDFLPHALSAENTLYKSIILILAGFLANALFEIGIIPRMNFLNRLLPKEKHDCHQHDYEHVHYHLMPSSVGCSAVGCFILCAFFDGIRFASSLLISVEAAIITGIGLFFHLLPESVTVIGIGLSSGFSRKSLLRIILVFCLAFLGGYQVFFLLSHIQSLSNLVLPFVLGLFIYLCCVHFIPMVIKLKKRKWFFIGAGLCFVLLELSHFGHH